MQGNFAQGNQGTLFINDVDLANRTSPYVSAAGSAVLDGVLIYSISYAAPNDSQMQLLAVGAARVVGKFKSDPTNVGLLQSRAGLNYSPRGVYFTFGLDTTEGKGPAVWWPWLLLGVLGATLAVLGVAVVRLTRRRRMGFKQIA